MSRFVRAGVVLCAGAALLLTGCNSGDSSAKPSATSASPSAYTKAASDAKKADLPTVTGSFGEAPTLKFPLKPGATPPPPEPEETAASTTSTDGATPSATPKAKSPYIDPPIKLQSIPLTEGKGAEIKQGNLVVVNYYGVVWGKSKPFDQSYEKKVPAALTLTEQNLIVGWVKGLTHQKVGSRMLLTIPPADGYPEGQSSAGIEKGDTLVFVIDILGQIDAKLQAQTDAKKTDAKTDVKVGGELGKEPTLSVAKGTKAPDEVKTTVLATGTGDPIKEGDQVLVQYKAVEWNTDKNGKNIDAGNTWGKTGTGLKAMTASKESNTPVSYLIGVPLGSRVLVELPGKDDTYQPVAAVIDLVKIVPSDTSKPF